MSINLRVETTPTDWGMTRAEVYCRDTLLCQHIAALEDVAVSVALLQVGIDLREERYALTDLRDEGGAR